MFKYEFSDDIYSTPEKKPCLLTRLMPSVAFYLKFAVIVLKAARVAKRGDYSRERWRFDSEATFSALESVGGKFQITGLEHLRELKSSCVIVSNHMSTLETTVYPALFLPFRDVAFVVKESLCTYPVFGHVMRAVDPIAVTRTNPREDLKAVMDKGTAMLASGRSVIIFPQTTRHLVFEPEKFNTIGVKLALKAGVPVLPVAIKTDLWGNGRFIKDFGKIATDKIAHIAIGAPMQVTGRGNDEHQRAIDFISAKLKEWGG